MDSEFASDEIALESNTQKGFQGTKILDTKCFPNFAHDELQEFSRVAPGQSIINMHCEQTVDRFSIPYMFRNEQLVNDMGFHTHADMGHR